MGDDSGAHLRRIVEETIKTIHPGSAEYPHRVELANYVTPAEVEVHLWAYLGESGLVVAGQDFGELVERLHHDTDYEYWVSVDWDDVPRVEALLRTELQAHKRPSVFELLRIAWDKGRFKTDVDFTNWLSDHGINSKFASY